MSAYILVRVAPANTVPDSEASLQPGDVADVKPFPVYTGKQTLPQFGQIEVPDAYYTELRYLMEIHMDPLVEDRMDKLRARRFRSPIVDKIKANGGRITLNRNQLDVEDRRG